MSQYISTKLTLHPCSDRTSSRASRIGAQP